MERPAEGINGRYTCDDYWAWQDDVQWEIVDGRTHCTPVLKSSGRFVRLPQPFYSTFKAIFCRVPATFTYTILEECGPVHPAVVICGGRSPVGNGRVLRFPDIEISSSSSLKPMMEGEGL
ncbi:MAG: hypothetical protein JW950_02650 [Deltaproteobacteria bacterium]|nr:hypothetical protein [Deltaproteobacteria bacterium]